MNMLRTVRVCLLQTIFLGLILAGATNSQSIPGLGNWGRSQINLVNNGYEGILAAIDPSIPPNEGLIQTFKNIFTSASSFLFNATNRRAFFKDVGILIPPSWPKHPTHQFAPHSAQLGTANIYIRPTEGNPDIPPQPFVRQPGKCGTPGEYMHLTSDFILNQNHSNWGDPAKVIVHEWGHLRWGLFDEYPTLPTDPNFYINSHGTLQGNKCSESIFGVAVPRIPAGSSGSRRGDLQMTPTSVSCEVLEGELPPDQCRFRPSNIERQTASGSLMYSTLIPSISSFCHSDPNGDPSALHSSESPTEQNRQCRGQSAWDVMLNSPDFLNETNPPALEYIDTTPTFTLIRQKLRTVIVIDQSGSMEDDEVWEDVIRMTQRFIRESPADSQVGLATYSNKPRIESQLQDMTSAGKASLLSAVNALHSPNYSSAVNPAQALRTAHVQVLLNNTGDYQNGYGSNILLFSGWKGNSNGVVRVIKMLRNQYVEVRAVEYGPPRNGTQGRSINIPGLLEPSRIYGYQPGRNPVEPVEPVFRDLANNPLLVPVVRLDIERVSPFANLTIPVHIDGTIGRHTTFRVCWDHDPVIIELRDPFGQVYNRQSTSVAVIDQGRQQMDFRFPGLIQRGTWHVIMKNLEHGFQSFELDVFSASSDPTRVPIRARQLVMQQEIDVEVTPVLSLYGEVKQGEMPVIGAVVTVNVDRPNTQRPVQVILRDTGVGADIRANDGIYSAYFTDFTEEGNYQLEMTVIRDSILTQQGPRWMASGVQPVHWDTVEQPPAIVTIDPFMRAPPETQVEVTGNVAGLMAVDRFPPARISDLEVLEFDPYTRTAKIRWTAMGNNYETGRASGYEIRYSGDANMLARSFWAGSLLPQGLVLNGNLMAPNFSFETEIMTVQIPPNVCNPVCGIRLQAFDGVGNRGEPSNMVTVVMTGGGPATTGQTFTSIFDVTRFGGRTVGGGGNGRNAAGTGHVFPPFGSTPRISGGPRPFPTSSSGGVDGITTKVPGGRPRGRNPNNRKTATIAAVTVVIVLLLITAVVIFSVIRLGFLKKKNRNQEQWATPHDAEADPEELVRKPKKKRLGRKVNDALVLEDM